MDPDELYTLRAQYWLGHYSLCIEEGKSLLRRPMPANLKEEREEFVIRAHLAMGNVDRALREAGNPDDESRPVALRALALRATYESSFNAPAGGGEDIRNTVISKLQTLLNDPDPQKASSSSLQLTASHVFLSHGDMTREALQCVHLGLTMEHLATSLQIYLKMDRLDLAEEQLSLMKQADEDAMLTQLCSAYLAIATGTSRVDDATYVLGSLSEQYGPSPMLLNVTAVAHMVAGRYEAAESALKEALREDAGNKDAMVNLVVCYQHLGKVKELTSALQSLKDAATSSKATAKHFYVQGLSRTEGALDREAVKYAPKS